MSDKRPAAACRLCGALALALVACAANAQQPAPAVQPRLYTYQRDEVPPKQYVRPPDEERFGLEVSALVARVAKLEEEIEELKSLLQKRGK